MSQPRAMSLTARGAAAFAAALALAAPQAQAQQPQQRQQQQQQQEPPPPPQPPHMSGLVTVTMGASRYQTPDGAVRFVFDRSGRSAALLRFEGDEEVHVLLPQAGSRGDEIYKNEDDSIRLRLTPQGGVTVYTRTIRTGAPVSEVAAVAPIAPQAIATAQLQERVRLLQIRAARAVGAPVQFVVPAQMSGQIAGLVVDAAERVAEGLSQAPLTNVRRVVITLGRRPGADLQGATLIVQVAPEMGYAGRPSSNAIRNVVTGAVQGPEN